MSLPADQALRGAASPAGVPGAAAAHAAHTQARPTVLVFAGVDPSGGAGIAADLQAIAAQGAHALTVVTALTAQDNERVSGVWPVEPNVLLAQCEALTARIAIGAVKIGIPGSAANALAIAGIITRLRLRQPDLPVVLDPVLASGHGDLLSRDDAVAALAPLLALVTLITPNGPEARALAGASVSAGGAAAQVGQVVPGAVADGAAGQAATLLARGCAHVLLTGGHDDTGDEVINRWFGPGAGMEGDGQHWRWPRLAGSFHGSGCTLASAAAALLAQRIPMATALTLAQQYCHRALAGAYHIADGQRIPLR